MTTTVGIGLLGCGTVGAAVADVLKREHAFIEARTGIAYRLHAIAIRDCTKRRPESLERELFTTAARTVVDDPRVDVVVELIGGLDDAATLVERALRHGLPVVTANKDLLATQGPRLRALAAKAGAALRYDAAVGGAIPVLRVLEEALAGDEILSVSGVINGTCTAILSAMEAGSSFDEALADAQRLGYAEADASSDVEGTDAAHKLAIIAQTAFGVPLLSPHIRAKGIAGIAQHDVARARSQGMRIRLVARAQRTAEGVRADVAPILLPEEHDFARTTGVENVVQIEARRAGSLTLRGDGAGGSATASSVLGDIVGVLRSIAPAAAALATA
jgi:homoserine dehydrogenase